MQGANLEGVSELEWMLQSSDIDETRLAEALVRDYYGLLFQYAYLRTHQPTLADAAARSALRQAVIQRHRYTGEIRLRTWLLAATAAACKKLSWQYYLGRMVGGGLKEAQPFFMDLSPLSAPASIAEPALVEQLKSLNDNQRSLGFLVFSAGLTTLELAVVMGVGLKTVQYSLDQLRQIGYAASSQGSSLPKIPPDHAPFIEKARTAAAGWLDLEEQASLDVHFVECIACRSYATQIGVLEGELQKASLAAFPLLGFTPQTELDGLVAEILGVRRAKAANRWTILTGKEISLGIAAMILFLLLVWYGSMFRVENERPILPTLSPTPQSLNVVVYRVTATPAETVIINIPPPKDQNENKNTMSETFDSISELLLQEIALTGSRVWSNSGSVALTMILNYWGWEGDYAEVLDRLQPNPNDEAVMPYEIINFAEEKGRMRAMYLQGGNTVLLSKLVSKGFPVIIQKGFDSEIESGWFGQFQVVHGYDKTNKSFLVQTNFSEDGPNNLDVNTINRYWRPFNYAFLVIYPAAKEASLINTLGPHSNATYAAGEAARMASEEIFTHRGRTQFFAWFNRGTSLAYLEDYMGAAKAYDEAMISFRNLPEKQRPWRMFWYQTRPYWAYYYTGRYQDVIDLATEVLDWSEAPILEESFYWRALAREALGDREGAIYDLNEALRINPNFIAGQENLKRLQEGT